MNRPALKVSALLVLTLGSVAAARPQDEWVAQVRRILQANARVFREHGYSLRDRIHTGSLGNGQSGFVRLVLAAGRQYQIMGACDSDCSDMDLELYGPAGEPVASLQPEDEDFILPVTPARGGAFQVKVIMTACSADPCRYGIALFGR
jgi:hypothetical protein